jgi:hypothetical protein
MVMELRNDITGPDAVALSANLRKGLPGRLADVAFHFGRYKIDQLDAIELTPHIAKPVAHVATQDKGLVCGFTLGTLVADKRDERHAGDLHLFVRHLV